MEIIHKDITIEIKQGIKFPFVATAKKATPKAKYSPYKVLFNYGFKNEDTCLKYVNDYLSKVIERENEKEKAKQDIKVKNVNLVASNHFKIGDIVTNSWGWEQTNVEFYQVIEVLPKSIKVREICQIEENTQSHGMACDVIPDFNNFIGEPFILKLKMTSWDNNVRICNPESYYYFSKWDGKPQYKSWYA